MTAQALDEAQLQELSLLFDAVLIEPVAAPLLLRTVRSHAARA